jgi:polyisoprenoid-binding protein YceI
MKTKDIISKTKWLIDHAHSEINFKVKHMMVAIISGKFEEFDASIYTTGDDFLNAEVDFWVNPASVYTSNIKRDAHLKNEDFFSVEIFREINFILKSCDNMNSDMKYEIYGNLTMKGITNNIKLEAEFGGIMNDPGGNTKAFFTLNGKINRKDWDLTWNIALDNGGVIVSEFVWINIELQLIKYVGE